MDKKTALEYLAGQAKRVTAKVVSIDLDAPISTTTELLERMSFQGLVERDKHDRPKEYLITPAGRERLGFLKSRDAAETHPVEPNPDGNAGASASGAAPSNPGPNGAASGEKLDALREELCVRLDALSEDVRDLLDALVPKTSSGAPAPTGSISSRLESLLARADRLTQGKGTSPEKPNPKIAALFQARKQRASLPGGWGRGLAEKRALGDTIEKLEAELGSGICERVERLVDLESRYSPEVEEIARLRTELGIESHDPSPAHVVA
jgi:DNA-binding MarR family transcriptional regulator